MRAQVLGSPVENPDPDRAEATSGLCDPAAVAVLAVAVQGVADRGSATGEIQTQVQDDFARISRRTLNKRMGDFDGRHNTALPVGTSKSGSKVLNRNNLLATRPDGEVPIHLPCELIRKNICVRRLHLVRQLATFLFLSTDACRVGQSFRVTVFSPRFPLRSPAFAGFCVRFGRPKGSFQFAYLEARIVQNPAKRENILISASQDKGPSCVSLKSHRSMKAFLLDCTGAPNELYLTLPKN